MRFASRFFRNEEVSQPGLGGFFVQVRVPVPGNGDQDLFG